MSEITPFDVFKKMAQTEDDIFLAPLKNIHRMQILKGGDGKITIGVDRETIEGLRIGQFCGGLLLADIDSFERVRSELEAGR